MPQGFVLLFLIIINDIVDFVQSNIKLFADDKTLYLTADNPANCADILNCDLSSVEQWSNDWCIIFNASNTDSMCPGRSIHQTTRLLCSKDLN